VDQWDWEKVITPGDRHVDYLQETVRGIYKAVYDTEQTVAKEFGIKPILPKEVVFATTDEMIAKYPHATANERENILCKEHGAVFLMGIGGLKQDGTLRRDGRAPDYDDWTTFRPDGNRGINGDLLVWNPLFQASFELSSMGIRVNPEVLLIQLALCRVEERKGYLWHQMLLDGTLPPSIGGGVGQSRLCQFMLRCAHIGEVQHGWYNPDEVIVLRDHNIELLGLGEFDDDPLVKSIVSRTKRERERERAIRENEEGTLHHFVEKSQSFD
jgi:aspartate--ammonia ligase